MPDGAWTALAGTAVGGLLAGGAAWMNGVAQSRRDRDKEDRLFRRTAFAEFLYRSDSLYNSAAAIFAGLRAAVVAGDGAAVINEARAAEITAELRREYVEHSRALQGLRLAGPAEVSERAEVRARSLAPIVNAIRAAVDGNAELDAAVLDSLGVLFQQYVDTAARFPVTKLMQKSLEP